jgi:hypothetical protein
MPRIPLHVNQLNPRTQQALRELNNELPDFLFVDSDHANVWVAYEDWFPEDKALDAVAKALDESGAGKQGIGIGQP